MDFPCNKKNGVLGSAANQLKEDVATVAKRPAAKQ